MCCKKIQSAEIKKTICHFPLPKEFILCGDNEISFTIPLLQINWPPVTWAGFPQKTPELRTTIVPL